MCCVQRRFLSIGETWVVLQSVIYWQQIIFYRGSSTFGRGGNCRTGKKPAVLALQFFSNVYFFNILGVALLGCWWWCSFLFIQKRPKTFYDFFPLKFRNFTHHFLHILHLIFSQDSSHKITMTIHSNDISTKKCVLWESSQKDQQQGREVIFDHST